MAKLFKVVVTVPEADGDMLRQAIGDAGGGKIGKYSHCSFTTKGIGRFLPQDGASPSVGEIGVSEAVIEERIEISCDDGNLDVVVCAIRNVHPYDEPVIDVYPLA